MIADRGLAVMEAERYRVARDRLGDETLAPAAAFATGLPLAAFLAGAAFVFAMGLLFLSGLGGRLAVCSRASVARARRAFAGTAPWASCRYSRHRRAGMGSKTRPGPLRASSATRGSPTRTITDW